MLDQKHGHTADRIKMRQVVRSKNMKLKEHTNKNANSAQVLEDLKSKNYNNLQEEEGVKGQGEMNRRRPLALRAAQK